ncbi:MAG: DUF4838 domain-containing protein [Saprospiraceae bacterium]|nr:DUF4838 domain-containing protein [Saprospiraceae bacterium]
MSKYIAFLFCILFVVSCDRSARDLVIVENLKSKYRIIYSEQASDSVLQAIQIFKANLKLSSGFEFMSFSDIVGPQDEEILIGQSNRNKNYLSTFPLSEVGDGYISAVKDKKWNILANSATGLSQGLLDVIVRMGALKLNENITQYNQKGKLIIPATPLIFKPSFSHRQAINPNALNESYRNWNFINIDNQKDWGTWEYSMERIFPSEAYFSTHPEYFAEVNGKKIPNQVNFAHPNLQADLEKNLEVWTMAKGRATYWAISPYPNHIVSEDEYTVKAIEETGSPSGVIVKLVNEIAKKNKGRTYAIWLDGPYRKAPTQIKPEPNVMLVLDTKDIDHATSIGTGPVNESFRNDLNAWKALTDNIAIISHVTNEERFMMPFPNLNALSKSLQYLHGQGVRKVIFNGVSGAGSSFPELKFYVASNLAWDVNQNLDSLIWKFCDNKYGTGAKAIYGYIKALENAVQSSGSKLSAYGTPADGFRSWLQPININQLYSYFNSTNSLTINNSELKELIELTRLSLIYTQLEVAKSMGTQTYGYFMNIGALKQLIKQDNSTSLRKQGAILEDNKPQWGTIQGMKDLLDQFVNDCDRMAVRVVDRSGLTPSGFREQILKYISQKVQVHGAFKKGSFKFNISPDPYFGDGDESLLNDGLLGIVENPKSTWVGLSGGEMEITWSVDKDTLLKSVSTRFLQQPNFRAWLPTKVTCLVSKDGSTFKEISTTSIGANASPNSVQTVSFNLGNQTLKAIKIIASGKKTCPKDHILSGQPAAMVLDELVIQ